MDQTALTYQVQSGSTLAAAFQPAAAQPSGSFTDYAKYGINRFLDYAEPIGSAISNGTDAVLNKFVDVGNWWNEWQGNNPVLNYTKDIVGGIPETIDDINTRNIENGIEVSGTRSLIGNVGATIGKGFNALTGGLDLLGAFAKDTQEGSSGVRTVTSMFKSVGTIGIGVGTGIAIGTLGLTALPAIAVGAGAAALGKIAFDSGESFVVNTAAPWIRSWF
jgi:hypothetical protein